MVIERASPARDRQGVQRLFTRDVALMRAILGDLNKISAMGPRADAPTWGNLSVQMTSSDQALVRWSLQPADDWSGGKLTLFGDAGQATLEMPARAGPWSLVVKPASSLSQTFLEWNEAEAVIEEFVRVFQGEPAAPTWQDACRDVETAATVERSLARGKTIELHEDEVSEEATFKGMMAVGGCGVLLLGLLALLVAATVEGLQLPFRHHLWWRLWPLYVLAPILVFLLLQPLRLVFRSETPDDPETKNGAKK